MTNSSRKLYFTGILGSFNISTIVHFSHLERLKKFSDNAYMVPTI